MAGGEYDWIDDAFDDAKPDPLAKKTELEAQGEYDWIDDAFDDSKTDPLQAKGMTGCSSLAVLAGCIAVVVILCFLAYSAFHVYAAFYVAASS